MSRAPNATEAANVHVCHQQRGARHHRGATIKPERPRKQVSLRIVRNPGLVSHQHLSVNPRTEQPSFVSDPWFTSNQHSRGNHVG